MLVEQQIAERRERAKEAIASILGRPDGQAFGDYRVKSASGKTYRVAMRGPGLFENFCSCPDFAVNTLGTCKHIESLLLSLRKRHGGSLERKGYSRTRASISLHYGETLDVRLRLPASPSPGLLALAQKYFDSKGMLHPDHIRRFDRVLDELRRLDDRAVVYSDALEYIDRENEIAEGLELERKLLQGLKRGEDPLQDVLKTKLLPYQVRGALFAACRGRVVLADDMGLGKTVQALAAAELLRRRKGIERVLVIAPASVKYQWKTEIERFTGLPVQVIDGLLPQRKRLYAAPSFFNLTSYELVLRDLEHMQALRPDLIILDEAQRIRNWATATARTIKQLKSRYAFVLTGTPLENKLEELYLGGGVRRRAASRARRSGSSRSTAWRTRRASLLGYRGLDRIHQQLEPILLRRTRKEVLHRTSAAHRPDLPRPPDRRAGRAISGAERHPGPPDAQVGEAGLALGDRPAPHHLLHPEHADAVQLHVSVRQGDQPLSQAGGVPRDHPGAGARGEPQGGGFQRIRAHDLAGGRGAAQAGDRLRLSARRRAGPQTRRADGEVPARSGLQGLSVHGCRRRGAQSSGGLRGDELRAALEPGAPGAAHRPGASPGAILARFR